MKQIKGHISDQTKLLIGNEAGNQVDHSLGTVGFTGNIRAVFIGIGFGGYSMMDMPSLPGFLSNSLI